MIMLLCSAVGAVSSIAPEYEATCAVEPAETGVQEHRFLLGAVAFFLFVLLLLLLLIGTISCCCSWLRALAPRRPRLGSPPCRCRCRCRCKRARRLCRASLRRWAR